MINIHSVNGYMALLSWQLGNILQLATQAFCRRFLDLKIDPCGRLRDQMEMAARTVPANIAEGSSRHQTSYETELRLLDVARASVSELEGDYLNWLPTSRHAAVDAGLSDRNQQAYPDRIYPFHRFVACG